MALSATSVLHFWTARYGSVPVIGRRPVHSRNSAGRWIDQQGVIQTAVVNTPRFGWATIDSERRQIMRLEQARTNGMLHSSDFSNAAWTKTNCTVNTGIADPAGGTTACTLTSTAANGNVQQSLAAGASIVRTNSIWLRRRTGTGTIAILDPTNSAWREVVPTSAWQRFSYTDVAGTARWHGVRLTTSGDAVDAFLAQQDDAASISSEIPTTSAAVTRATDSFYWDFMHAPQAMMAYFRIVRRHLGGRVFQISNAADAAARFFVFASPLTVHHENAANVSIAAAADGALGDTIEGVALLKSDGKVRLIQSINGAAVTDTGESAATALAATWSDTRLWLNSAGSSDFSMSDFAELKIVKYADVVASTAQGIMDELRNFELGPSQQLL